MSARAPIRVTFSEAVKFGTKPVTLSANGVEIPIACTLSADAKVMSISPTSEIPLPTKLSVDFGDISDLRGNALIRPTWSWSVPQWLQFGNSFPSQGGDNIRLSAGPSEQVNVTVLYSNDNGPLPSQVFSIGQPSGSWQRLPGSPGRTTHTPAVVVDKDGALVVATVDESTWNLVVQRYRSQEWEQIGGPFPVAATEGFSLAVDAGGILFLAYDAPTSSDGSNVVVKALARGETNNWTPLRASVNDISTTTSVRLESLALDSRGTPYVAYRVERTENGRTTLDGFVRSWSAGQWRAVGNALNASDEEVRSIKVTADATNTPFVAVQLDNIFLSRSQLLIRRFDGSAWTNCGPEIGERGKSLLFSPMRGGHLFAYIAVDDAFRTFDVTATGWTQQPSPSLMPDLGPEPSAAIDPAGIPIIGWNDTASNIHVVRLNR
ncbi:Ig-like domain-containing protein [Pendulispora brunnea]|uniref:Ig-like domain-containing protein n=1 Tax=Pendulispora brunnea TaxID=2905690 RepID=A0ABZ2K4P2_9BACT